MSAKTKIIVIRKSQLAFTLVIFIIVLLLAGLIISAIVTQAHPKANSEPDTAITSGSTIQYAPGVYTSTVILNDAAMEVQVIVDKDHINSISLTNLDESIETAYPLVQPAIEELTGQITDSQSIDNVTYSESNQYTSMILYNAICDALDKASADNT